MILINPLRVFIALVSVGGIFYWRHEIYFCVFRKVFQQILHRRFGSGLAQSSWPATVAVGSYMESPIEAKSRVVPLNDAILILCPSLLPNWGAESCSQPVRATLITDEQLASSDHLGQLQKILSHVAFQGLTPLGLECHVLGRQADEQRVFEALDDFIPREVGVVITLATGKEHSPFGLE